MNAALAIFGLDKPVIFNLAVAAACFLTGLSKGGLGGAIGFLLTPMLALVMPPAAAVGLLLPVLIVGDTFTLAAYWRRWDGRQVRLLMVGGMAGIALATFALAGFPPVVLKKGLGVLALIFVAYRFLEARLMQRLAYTPRLWHAITAGSLAGFTSTLAHAGGPPITMYLLMQRLAPEAFIATSGLFFALLNWAKAPFYYYAGMFDFRLMLQQIWLAPLIPLGVYVGRSVASRVNQRRFDLVITILLLISGVLLLAR